MKNGTEKTGYISVPKNGKSSTIKFSSSEKGKTEKIAIENVTSIKLTIENKEVIYHTLFLNEAKTFGGFKLSNSKRWAKLVYEGTLKFYSVYATSTNEKGFSTGFWEYYLLIPGEKSPYYYDVNADGGLYFKIGNYKIIYIGLRAIFKNKCPKVVEAYGSDEFKDYLKENGMKAIDEYYVENCVKK